MRWQAQRDTALDLFDERMIQSAVAVPTSRDSAGALHMMRKMFEGTVVSINITPQAAAPMQSVDEVRAIPGRGLEGDRYFDNKGRAPDVKRELTLIEAEAIEALKRELNVDYGLGDSRRNVVTRGVPLNHLVGKEFWVGEVKARGIMLCEPCAHLQKLTVKQVLPGLVHRGGLRAQILTEGTIRVGATVTEE